MSRVSGEPLSERLYSAAAELFWSKGYSATTTRELAELLGVRPGSIYYHVEKKEDLLYTLCVESLSNIHSAAEESVRDVEEPVERVKALIGAHVTAMLEDKDKHATMLTELRALSPDRREDVIRLRDAYEGFVRSVIADAQTRSGLRTDVSAKYLALCLLDLMNWAIFWFRSDSDLSPEALSRTFAALFIEGAANR